MFSILVPTDFSNCSNNAVDYAAAMANAFGASLTIMHAAESVGSSDTINKESQLHDSQNKIQAAYPELKTETLLLTGYALAEIYQAVNNGNYDIVIMGTHGVTKTAGFEGAPIVFESLFGSVTAGLVGYSSIPIMAIHEGTVFTPPKEFILLSDFHQMPSTDSYRFLSLLASKFESKVNIVFVEDKPTYLSEAFQQMNRIEEIFVGIPFEYTVIKAKNVEQTLIDMPFTQEQIITVISKEKSGIKEFLGQSTSQDLVSFLNATLLVLPEYIAIYPTE